MKIYVVSRPEQLERAAGMVKWDRDRAKLLNVLKQWQSGSIEPVITLEVTRNAHLFVTDEGGKKTLLGTMYVAGAKEFVKELSEK